MDLILTQPIKLTEPDEIHFVIHILKGHFSFTVWLLCVSTFHLFDCGQTQSNLCCDAVGRITSVFYEAFLITLSVSDTFEDLMQGNPAKIMRKENTYLRVQQGSVE